MTYIADLVQMLTETIPWLRDIAEDEGQCGDAEGYDMYISYAEKLERFIPELKACNNLEIHQYILLSIKKLPAYDEDTFATALRVYNARVQYQLDSYQVKLNNVGDILKIVAQLEPREGS